jgi:hypothetical protein
MKTPAWQRKEGKSPSGGLNAKGRASAKAEGMNLKAPVKSGDNPRRHHSLREWAISGPEMRANGSRRGARQVADARAKAKAISARNKK